MRADPDIDRRPALLRRPPPESEQMMVDQHWKSLKPLLRRGFSVSGRWSASAVDGPRVASVLPDGDQLLSCGIAPNADSHPVVPWIIADPPVDMRGRWCLAILAASWPR